LCCLDALGLIAVAEDPWLRGELKMEEENWPSFY